jgi:tryptophanyl-tRNA synthetase
MQNSEEIDIILSKGAERARKIAGPILQKTYEIIGMLQP